MGAKLHHAGRRREGRTDKHDEFHRRFFFATYSNVPIPASVVSRLNDQSGFKIFLLSLYRIYIDLGKVIGKANIYLKNQSYKLAVLAEWIHNTYYLSFSKYTWNNNVAKKVAPFDYNITFHGY